MGGRAAMKPRTLCICAAIFMLSAVNSALACSLGRAPSPVEMVVGADLILRATAVEYSVAPADSRIRTSGVPDSRIRFHVESVLKGTYQPTDLVLPGYL